MAVLFADSFQLYGTTIANAATRYTLAPGGSLVAGAGRFGGYALRTNSIAGWENAHAARTRVTQAISGKLTTLNSPSSPTAGTRLYFWLDGATVQASFHVFNDGSVHAYRGATTALLGATAPGAFLLNVWNRYEGQCVAHATTGEMHFRVNGVSVLSLTGLNTRVSAANQITNSACFSRTSQAVIGDVQDYIVTDDQGAVNTNFLGDKRSYIGYASADGAYAGSDAAVPSGARYQAVDETTGPDDDATYVPYSAAAQRNSYEVTTPPANITGIVCTQQIARIRKDDAGPNEFKLFLRSGAVDSADGSAIAVPSTFAYYNRLYELDPETGALWLPAKVTTAGAVQPGLVRSA